MRAVRAVGALLVLLALVVGVPIALAALAGWPLPTAWPNGDQLRFAARDGWGDGVWIKLFALVVWLAWAQLAVAVLRELLAAARHRTRPARAGWAPALAGRLVGALLVSSGAVNHLPHAAAAGPVIEHSVSASVTALAAPAVSSAQPVARQHLVIKGETLSSIAEDELGTQAAWPFLWETNRGRSFGTRVFEDPDLILPGWDLAVPGPGSAPAPSPAPAPAAEPVTPVLIPPLVLAAPADAAPVERVTPDVILEPVTRTDDILEPATPTGAPSEVAAHAEPTDATAPAWARFTAFTGAALLATGALGLVRSSRRRALRSVTGPVTVAASEGELGEAVTALVAGTDAVGLARMELALRALAGRLARSGSEARVLAVRRASEAIEVVLDRPAAPVTPWHAGGADDGETWVLPASVSLRELTDDARSVAAPCPALVGLGSDDSGAEILVDLEAVGVLDLGCGGGRTGRADVARHLAAALAVTPLADELRVVTVGEVLPELDGRHEVRSMPDLAGAVAEVEAMTAPLAAATGGHRSTFPSTFHLRAVAGHEPWEPVVVILRDPPCPDDPAWTTLVALAAAERGVAVVGAGLPVDPDAPVRSTPDGSLTVARWTVQPHELDEPDARLLSAVITDATTTLDDTDVDTHAEIRDDTDLGHSGDEPWTFMVRVLGPVDVVTRDGAPVEFDRPKALELVVWLAQHRATATRTGARAALWESDVSNASFSNVVSDARRALARSAPAPSGDDARQEWLARTYAEKLPLHPEVVLDADLVRGHLKRAHQLADDDAIDELRQALALVRGAPYSGRCYLWPDAEALPSTLTLLATTVALELGRRLLERGDVDAVLDATAVGLDVLPGHEELVALRLRAHAARGDRVALRHEYASYEQSLLADPWAGDPSPALVALRQELLTPVAGS